MVVEPQVVMIVPFNSNPGALFVGLRETRAEKVVLVVLPGQKKALESVEADLKKFRVNFETLPLQACGLEEMFQAFYDLRVKYPKSHLVVNLGCADKGLTCAALSASFVNGLPAFEVSGDSVASLPVLKFDYYRLLSDKKLELLRKISEKGGYRSFEELGKDAGMSLPLVSYHIRGTRTSEGLAQMGLVTITENKKKLNVQVSTLGRLLLKGYVHPTVPHHPLR